MQALPLALAVTRGLNMAATLGFFGTAVSRLVVMPAILARSGVGGRDRVLRQLTLVLHVNLITAFVTSATWLIMQAGDMSNAATPADALRAVPTALLSTRFGHALIARLLLLLSAALAFASGNRPAVSGLAALLAGSACAAQAWMGHAAAVTEITLPAAEILHVLAAGAWLGGLVPLWLVVRDAPSPLAALAAQRFSPLGIACVLVLAGTAFLQGRELIGSIPGLIGTAYGQVALIKLGLLLLLLGLAALNRFRFTPQVVADDPDAKHRLRLSIALEAVIGLAVVLAAARLAELFPASHEQPVWPFPWRIDLARTSDPNLRRGVLTALLGVAVAVVLAVLSMPWRRLRWLSLPTAALAGAFAVPRLGPLVVEAYPTTFFQSPSDFSAGSIVRGADLFTQHCASCHGTDGRGDGPSAKDMPVPPADLTAVHIWSHLDGEMFWWLSQGITDPNSDVLAMPGFGTILSSDGRWNLIDYIHARAAGAEFAGSGWPVPVQAPEVDIACLDGGYTMGDLRGHVVRIVAIDGRTPPALPPSEAGVITIVVTRGRAASANSVCAAQGRDAWRAYAIVAGISPDAFAGTQLLVDAAGWLRLRWRPGEASGWTRPADLEAAIEAIAQHPLTASTITGHHHR